jgi:soluble lytic murein transglycosylase-like protein
MDHKALNDNDGNVSSEAAARRRRMHYRYAKRRLTRIGVVALTVFTAAQLLTPERAPQAAASQAEAKAGANARMVAKPAITASSNLPLMPSWRPAGEVLKRKPSPGMVLPFSTDPREIERREALNRWHRIYTFSTRFRIKSDLARKIYDAAMTAGIEPELAFRLIRVESRFDPSAVSPVGAMGLSQLMLGTAKEFEPNVTREDLLDPDVNLRIGFRYLRALIREYKDLKIALLVYNRGPVAVQNALALGLDPANGYENVIMRGYRGRGLLE